ncbi:GNAT family N-acetyltransferase [Moheibacter sediminis]|uniref:ElaA protein n=1 Tax=Moheibacter sediminis TaxID=1434700 RepID=A0A1W1ZLB1_9FLAO|nr:GNAT family N-acetyltransferase [Moheibacter sediminis]SMC49033.1 ElaA protein [Moheibacter sediminis]
MTVIWHFKNFDELTTKELYEILQLRAEVFVVEQNCPYNDIDGKDLKCGHLWAVLENKIIACTRIVPPGVSYNEASIGRVASHADYRHLKLGYQLMSHSLEIIENVYETTSVRISAQSYLKNFYEKCGFKQVSEEYLEDDIPHMEMWRS